MPGLTLDKEQSLNWIMQGRLQTPTLVVWGYNDPTALFRRGQWLFDIIAESNPGSQMHVLNRAGHFCYREQAVAFNEAVKGFVKSLR